MLLNRTAFPEKSYLPAQRPFLALSQLISRRGPVVAFCIASVTGFPGYGQTASHRPVDTTKQCDGVLPTQRTGSESGDRKLTAGAGSATGSEAAQAESGKTGEHLKLSTKTAAENKSDVQGEFCRRERPGQDTFKPSAPASQPNAASEPATSEPAPPIAELRDGKLIIRASGQDFAAVLDAVRSATGIKVEMPGESASEPVYMKLGPAPVKEAVVALMEGSSYNYILLGSATDPQKVQELILSARPAAGQGSLVAANSAAAGTPPVTAYGAAGFRADPDADAAEDPGTPAQPMQPTEIPSSVPTGIDIQQMAAQQNKSPGQILDELQRHQLEVLDQQAAAAQAQSQPQ